MQSRPLDCQGSSRAQVLPNADFGGDAGGAPGRVGSCDMLPSELRATWEGPCFGAKGGGKVRRPAFAPSRRNGGTGQKRAGGLQAQLGEEIRVAKRRPLWHSGNLFPSWPSVSFSFAPLCPLRFDHLFWDEMGHIILLRINSEAKRAFVLLQEEKREQCVLPLLWLPAKLGACPWKPERAHVCVHVWVQETCEALHHCMPHSETGGRGCGRRPE